MLESSATDEEILKFIDSWAELLEKEDFSAAFNLTKHNKNMDWTPDSIKLVIKSYGDCELTQKVTFLNNGLSIDGAGNILTGNQNKEVVWLDEKSGYIWYDLNIDNYVSDLTATFDFLINKDGIDIFLNEIFVM